MGYDPDSKTVAKAPSQFALDVLGAMADAFGAAGGGLTGVFASGTNPYQSSYTEPRLASETGYMGWGETPTVYGPEPTTTTQRSSGGGGGYTAATSKALENAFIDWFGYVPSTLLATAKKQGWTEDNIRRAAVTTKDAHGALLIRAQQTVRQIGALWFGGDPAAVTTSLVNSIISDGIYADQDYLKNTYFPALKGAGADNPAAKAWVDYWIEQTGRPLSGDALTKMSNIIKTYGFTQDSMSAWENYVKTTDSAITGNYGATIRAAITQDFITLLGRAPTELELSAPGTKSITGTQAGTTTRPVLSAGSTKSADIMALKKLLNAAGWQPPLTENDPNYGPKMTAAVKWYQEQNGLPVTGTVDKATWEKIEPPAPIETTTTTIDETTGQFWYENSDMRREQLRLTSEYQEIYSGKPDWMTEENYIDYARALSSVYTWYYGATIDSPEKDENGNPIPDTGLERMGIRNLASEELAAAVNSGLSPTDIRNAFEAHQNAIIYEGQYGATVLEAFDIGFTHEEWEDLARGGENSGALKAKLMEAQNRVAFRETFREYMGRDPDAADYDELTSNFVSAAEYSRRMSARESAAEMLPEINDLMTRVYGRSVTQEELENLALGGKGSGELKAKIAQAKKLDEYTEMYRQYYGNDPTPDDYASFITKYRSTAELQWEITVNEKMKELGPEMQATWKKVYQTDLSDEELRIMLGEQEGYGDLRRQMKEAEEKVQKEAASIRGAHTGEKFGTTYGMAEGGGFRMGIQSIGDLGA